jgi:serine protease DegQ
MRKFWLIFSQAVTVTLAVLFVVATLKPHWLANLGTIAGRNDNGAPSIVAIRESAPSVAGAAATAQLSYSAAAKRAVASVVSITTTKTVRNPQANDPLFRFFFGDGVRSEPLTGLGSGVIVSADGYVLTNNHVVEGVDEIELMLADGRKLNAKIVGTDPETDLAVLRVQGDKLPAITLGSVDKSQVGDVVLAVGNPFGVGQTVTLGIISALGRTEVGINTFENFIQTDAAINPGNSGGALVDASGNLIGINTAIYSRSGGSLGIGFAIPVSTARQVMEQIISNGEVVRGWIGVEPQLLTPELAETFGLKNGDSAGVVIAGVIQGGPADRAGLKPGEVVTAVNGQPLKQVSDLLNNVAALKPGSAAQLTVLRGANQRMVDVTVGKRPKAAPTQQRRR